MIFIMRPNPAAPSLLQFDLNGLSDDGTLLGVTAASVDEETQLQEVIFSLLNTSSVSTCFVLFKSEISSTKG